MEIIDVKLSQLLLEARKGLVINETLEKWGKNSFWLVCFIISGQLSTCMGVGECMGTKY